VRPIIGVHESLFSASRFPAGRADDCGFARGTLADIGQSARRRSRSTACREYCTAHHPHQRWRLLSFGHSGAHAGGFEHHLGGSARRASRDQWRSCDLGLEEGRGPSLDGGCHGTGIPAVVHQRPARAAGTDAQFRLLPHRRSEPAGQTAATSLSRRRYPEGVGRRRCRGDRHVRLGRHTHADREGRRSGARRHANPGSAPLQ